MNLFKKQLAKFALMATSCAVMFSCSSSDDDGPVTPIDPVDTAEILSGDLSTRTLSSGTKYLLRGQVFVQNGNTLTIEPGTVIMGEKATKGTLIINRGGKIMAAGTESSPIVMTSNQDAGARDRGDWGGLVIVGKAPNNQGEPAIEGISPSVNFGGTDENDNSGVLKYVRVEFAGIELTPNNETNSITMGSVGAGTVMENLMVSYGGDDGFEWFGGSVNGKNMISFGMWDDDFDVDYGYSGKVQYGLVIRYPSYADQSGSNAFECDNGPNDNQTAFLTTGTFSNFTAIGPRLTPSQSINANYQHSIDLRRRTAVTIANSVFLGFPRGIRMNQQSVVDNYTAGTGALINNILVAPAQTFLGGNADMATATEAYWTSNNTTITDYTNDNYNQVLNQLGLNSNLFFGNNTKESYGSPTLVVNSGHLTSGANFSHPKLANPFFEQVSFIGAFGGSDWTSGWAAWDPVTRNY
ncbi:MAG: hypothetical protein Q4G27_02695 [Flavobacteriaceae bacterium]|nr:hypothetical protein [Flavobacteriaceae bacterium]